MNKEELIEVEEKIRQLFLQKKIRIRFHLNGGNEDESIEIFKKIKDNDWLFTNHRNHYHVLLKGMTQEELIDRTLNGKSMHIFSKDLKIFSSSIVSGIVPIALGVAMGIKINKEDSHVWCFVGDMAAEMGIFHECTRYAGNFHLPITFIVEDNGTGIMNTKECWGELCEPHIIRYRYEMTRPHAYSGDWVDFNDI